MIASTTSNDELSPEAIERLNRDVNALLAEEETIARVNFAERYPVDTLTPGA